MARAPKETLAGQVLPAPLYRALRHVFAQGITDCMLVGGTALAGYYAGHRRSDDLDLFVRDAPALQAAILAVESLRAEPLGAELVTRQRTPQFYDANARLEGHGFTVQVVLDGGVFAQGEGTRAGDGVCVASLRTLLMQKAATLVSRCAEKDLYDLRWLLQEHPHLKASDLIELGARIDGGMTAEAALISLTTTPLRPEACDFSHSHAAAAVFQQVSDLKESLARELERLARKQAQSPLDDLVRRLR